MCIYNTPTIIVVLQDRLTQCYQQIYCYCSLVRHFIFCFLAYQFLHLLIGFCLAVNTSSILLIYLFIYFWSIFLFIFIFWTRCNLVRLYLVYVSDFCLVSAMILLFLFLQFAVKVSPLYARSLSQTMRGYFWLGLFKPV